MSNFTKKIPYSITVYFAGSLLVYNNCQGLEWDGEELIFQSEGRWHEFAGDGVSFHVEENT